MEHTATGLHVVATESGSRYLIDCGQHIFVRLPKPDGDEFLTMRGDFYQVRLLQLVKCVVGERMLLILDLGIPGIAYTNRQTTTVVAIAKVPADVEDLERHSLDRVLGLDTQSHGRMLTLPSEERVAIAGDWHGDTDWVRHALPKLHTTAPDVQTILHLGDFEKGDELLAVVDEACRAAGISRVLVTPGNHEDWGLLHTLFAAQPGEPVQLSTMVWALPRGFRFQLADRSFLSFGGAASIDYARRTTGFSWWPTEIPADNDVAAAITGAPVDVLLAHDTVDGGTAETELVLRSNRAGWSAEALDYAAMSRARVTRVWDDSQAKVLAHGHFHTQGEIELPSGRRVYSVAANNNPGNIALLRLRDLAWAWVGGI